MASWLQPLCFGRRGKLFSLKLIQKRMFCTKSVITTFEFWNSTKKSYARIWKYKNDIVVLMLGKWLQPLCLRRCSRCFSMSGEADVLHPKANLKFSTSEFDNNTYEKVLKSKTSTAVLMEGKLAPATMLQEV